MRGCLIIVTMGVLGTLVCLPSAGAAPWRPTVKVQHRTMNLKTILDRGVVIMTPRDGNSITIRAPKSAAISRNAGGLTGHFVHLTGRLNKAKTARLFDVSFGTYYAAPQNKTFRIDPRCFMEPPR